jgi:glycosyltransferase involved in cell wall biosynthesis
MGILRTGKHRVAYRLMSGAPDAVFAVSEQVRRHCIEIDKIDPMRVSTVYNGLDLTAWDRTSPVGGNSRKIHVTTAGNIRRVKGHDIFIRAAAAVIDRFPDTIFSIAGEVLDPHYFEELQALVVELKLGHHFHFAGGVANLKEYLSSADIFVLPSRSEGFSNAIIEAMAASLPVVATDVGGNAEAVKEGQSGFIVPPENPEALAAAISRLLADMPLAAVMGTAGKTIVSENFTTEAMMKRITGIYDKLLSAK